MLTRAKPPAMVAAELVALGRIPVTGERVGPSESEGVVVGGGGGGGGGEEGGSVVGAGEVVGGAVEGGREGVEVGVVPGVVDGGDVVVGAGDGVPVSSVAPRYWLT